MTIPKERNSRVSEQNSEGKNGGNQKIGAVWLALE